MDQIPSQNQNPAPNPPSLGMSSLVLIGAIFVLFVSVAGVGIYLYLMPNNLDTPQTASSIQEEYDAVVDLDQQGWGQEFDIDKDLSQIEVVKEIPSSDSENSFVDTDTVEEIVLTNNDSGSAVLVECGESRFTDQLIPDRSSTFAERKQFNNVYSCLKEQFATCTPAKGSLFTGRSYTNYKIEGIVSGKCQTELSFYSPGVGSLEGKTMTCFLDNSDSLFQVASDVTQCSGTLVNWINKYLEPVAGNLYTELYNYNGSNGNIYWEHKSFRGIAKLLITDAGVNVSFAF